MQASKEIVISFKIHLVTLSLNWTQHLSSSTRVPFPYCVNTFLFGDFASCFAFNSSKFSSIERSRRKKICIIYLLKMWIFNENSCCWRSFFGMYNNSQRPKEIVSQVWFLHLKKKKIWKWVFWISEFCNFHPKNHYWLRNNFQTLTQPLTTC